MAAYTGTLPASVGTDPEVETSQNYIFRRFHYGSGSPTYPRLAFPKGSNPAR